MYVIKKIFKNDIKNLKINLNAKEEKIILAILKRKYKNELEILNKNVTIKEKIEQCIKSSSIKRPEENYKFIFKRCLKHLKEQMKNSLS